MKEILSFFNPKDFKKNWPTLEGFIFYSVLLFFVVLITAESLNDAFSDINLSFEKFLKIEAIVLSIHAVIWFVYKQINKVLPVKSNRVNIAIAVEYDKKSKGLYLKTLETFKKKFREVDTNSRFNLFELPESKEFLNNKEAERFISNEGINLLIWGHTEQGNIGGIATTIFHLKFSYNFITVAQSLKELSDRQENFIQDINKVLIGRLWKVVRPNTLPDLRVVSENISEVSLYIIIKVIASYGLWLEALRYCDELLAILKKYNNPSLFPRFNEFEGTVKQTAADLANSISYHYSVTKNDFKTAKNYLSKALTYVENFFPALINLARISWLEGNKSEAKRFNKLAKKQSPGSNLVRLNNAFFALEEERFKSAVAAYKKIKSLPKGSNIFNVTTFLYSVFKKTNKPQYLFGSGLLNCRFGDPITGARELRKFMKLVKEKKEYKPLTGYASGTLVSHK